MPLVAIDSNILDEIALALDVGGELAEAMEALDPPPLQLSRRGFAWYWLLALAPYWTSCLYTFSDSLYEEVSTIPPSKRCWRDRLLGLAVEIRESHPEEVRVPDPAERPASAELIAIGLDHMDAKHVADAVGLGASHFLTCDRGILKRGVEIGCRFRLAVTRPEAFLLDAVRSGAPWPVGVPWPWETGPMADGSD